jgi:hypothetical protein
LFAWANACMRLVNSARASSLASISSSCIAMHFQFNAPLEPTCVPHTIWGPGPDQLLAIARRLFARRISSWPAVFRRSSPSHNRICVRIARRKMHVGANPGSLLPFARGWAENHTVRVVRLRAKIIGGRWLLPIVEPRTKSVAHCRRALEFCATAMALEH